MQGLRTLIFTLLCAVGNLDPNAQELILALLVAWPHDREESGVAVVGKPLRTTMKAFDYTSLENAQQYDSCFGLLKSVVCDFAVPSPVIRTQAQRTYDGLVRIP